MPNNFSSNPFNFQECSTEDLINGLMHMANDHPCCRATTQMTIDKIREMDCKIIELENKIENRAPNHTRDASF